LPKFNPPSPPAGDIIKCPGIDRDEFPEQYKPERAPWPKGPEIVLVRGSWRPKVRPSSKPERVVVLRFEPWQMCVPERTSFDFPIIHRRWLFDRPAVFTLSARRKAEMQWRWAGQTVFFRLIYWRRVIPHAPEHTRPFPRPLEGGPREPQYEDWIRRIARKISRWWGVRVNGWDIYNELVQTAGMGFIEARPRYDPAKGEMRAFAGVAASRACWQFLRGGSSITSVPKNLEDYRRNQESGGFWRPVYLDEENHHELVSGTHDEPTLWEVRILAGGTEAAEAWAEHVLDGRLLQVLLGLLHERTHAQLAGDLGISSRTVYRDQTLGVRLIKEAMSKSAKTYK
jgi:DNA-directed RNA polymerase specialized sigma24 family protein